MKKSLFILFIAFLFVSCTHEFDDITYNVTNDSSVEVSFSFHNETKSLSTNDSVSYTINSAKGIFIPENMIFSGHPRSILLQKLNMGTSGIFYTFLDNKPLVLNVHNTLPRKLKLIAYDNSNLDLNKSDYINTDDDKSFLEIDENASETAKIYTSTPFFIVYCNNGDDSEPNWQLYIATIDWKLTNDIMNVTIK